METRLTKSGQGDKRHGRTSSSERGSEKSPELSTTWKTRWQVRPRLWPPQQTFSVGTAKHDFLVERTLCAIWRKTIYSIQQNARPLKPTLTLIISRQSSQRLCETKCSRSVAKMQVRSSGATHVSAPCACQSQQALRPGLPGRDCCRWATMRPSPLILNTRPRQRCPQSTHSMVGPVSNVLQNKPRILSGRTSLLLFILATPDSLPIERIIKNVWPNPCLTESNCCIQPHSAAQMP